MSPSISVNWWDDIKQVEIVTASALGIGINILTFLKMARTDRRVEVVRSLVVDNGSQILSEVATAHQALERVVVAVNGKDRRGSPASGNPKPNIIERRDAAEEDLRRRFSDRLPP